MKILVVGDPHAVRSELKECRALMNWCVDLYQENKCDMLLITGDLFHSHSQIDSYVMDFWREFSEECIKKEINCVVLVGNHDLASERMKNSPNALSLLHNGDYFFVVDDYAHLSGFIFIAYKHNKEEFISYCNSLSEYPTVFCHQEFEGAQYENGFYAPNGVKLDDLPNKLFISGHIHTKAQFGKCIYVGSPRWRIASDANVSKSVSIFEFDGDNNLLNRTEFDTSTVCKAMYTLEDTEINPAQIPTNASVVVDIYGTKEYISKRKRELAPLGVKVRGYTTKEKKIEVHESQGLHKAFETYLSLYQPVHGSNKEELTKLALELIKL